jgi:hypothetical protein
MCPLGQGAIERAATVFIEARLARTCLSLQVALFFTGVKAIGDQKGQDLIENGLVTGAIEVLPGDIRQPEEII